MRDLPRRIVDEDVEPAELLLRVLDEPAAEAFVADVARQRDALAPGLLDELDHLPRIGFFLRQIIDRDIGAFARESDRHGAADAGIAARDQRLAALQAPRAAIARLAVIGLRHHLAGKAGPGLLLFREGPVRLARNRIDERRVDRGSAIAGIGRRLLRERRMRGQGGGDTAPRAKEDIAARRIVTRRVSLHRTASLSGI